MALGSSVQRSWLDHVDSRITSSTGRITGSGLLPGASIRSWRTRIASALSRGRSSLMVVSLGLTRALISMSLQPTMPMIVGYSVAD